MFEIVINKRVNKFIDGLQNSDKIRDKLRRLRNFKSNERLGLNIARFRDKDKNRYREL